MLKILLLITTLLASFNSGAQNQAPLKGFNDAFEASLKIADNNPKWIKHLMSNGNPNEVAMCAALGMKMTAFAAVNPEVLDGNVAKLHALNAAGMSKATQALIDKGFMPKGQLMTFVNIFNPMSMSEVVEKNWASCDRFLNINLIDKDELALFLRRPYLKSSNTILNTLPKTTLKAPLKVSFVYVGKVGDSGWTFSHEIGRRQIEKVFGEKVVTTFVENVPENADAERVIRDIVAQGNNIIFGTTFGYMEPLLKVASANKGVKFEHATGYKTTENMRTYESRTYESAYLAGVIAGKMTKTNVLGFVAPIPIPEVIRNINSYTMGAQSVNPKIKTKVVWVNEWFNPVKEAEATASLINSGADVLMQNTDSSAVLQTAEKLGKRAFGWDSDMTAYAPKAHLGSAVINWGPYYVKTVRDALEGKWTGNQTAWWGVKEGAVDLVSVAADVPEEAKKKLNEVKFGLKNGSLVIWKGPIVGQDGKFVLSRNAVADDKFLSGINFYVQGVDGKIPGQR